jgi:hypothetical protein
MRELVFVGLLACLVVGAQAVAETGTDATAPIEENEVAAETSSDPMTRAQAREQLTDLLFRDDIHRIDFQATSFEAGTTLINTTSDTILDIGLPIFGDAAVAAAKGVEVIEALDASKIRGLYGTFENDKQTIVINSAADAKMLGEVVGAAMSIIHAHYGADKISYRDKAANIFRKVRMDPDDTLSMVEEYLDTMQHVARLSSGEQAKYLN